MSHYTFEALGINSTLFGMNCLQQMNSKLHSHSFLEIAYVVNGSCEHFLNGQRTELKKGDYFIIDYNCVHQYFCTDPNGIELLNCMFQPVFIDPAISECNSFKNLISSYSININYKALTFDPSHYVFFDEDGQIYSIFKQMYDEYTKQNIGYTKILQSHLSNIIILTLRKIYDKSFDEKFSLTDNIIQIIKKRYNENNLLKKLCDDIHYSMSYISRKFAHDTGMTFKEYQTNIRIDNACRLLTTSDKKTSEIAELVGYNDIAFFTSVFKKKTGVTPTEFRRIAKNNT